MSIIVKEYWSFEENQILHPYQLGQIIEIDKESQNLKKSADWDFDYDYIGNEKFLWVLTIKDNKVVRIIYKANFPFPDFEFWKNHYDVIKECLLRKSKLVNEEYLGDRMVVISRDSFVNLIILQKGRESF